MRTIVLVGGFGTRLRPLTLTTPKQMLPINGVPMIERVMATLAGHGIDEVVLSMGYRPDAFFEAYPDDRCAGVRLHYAVEPEPLDTAGAIRFAATEAGVDGTFLVVNGDVVTDIDLGALVTLHRDRRAEGTLALTQVEDPSRYGVVPVDEHDRVTGFIEKPPADEAPTNWINAGLYVFEAAMLDRVAAGRKVSIEREIFPAMVEDGTLYAQHTDGYWVDAGLPATYLQVQLDLIDGVRGHGEPAVADDAEVAAGADVVHTVVMAGAAVDDGAVVRDSVLLPGARVATGAVVEGSVIGRDAVVGARAHLRQLCVIGDGTVVDADADLSAVKIPEAT